MYSIQFKSVLIYALVLLGSLTSTTNLSAQSKQDLERERNRIIEEIEKTNTFLKKKNKEKSSTITDLSAINNQVENRAKLVNSVKEALALSDQQIKKNEKQIDSLSTLYSTLQEEYGKILRYEYLQKLSNKKWTYLLSAENLNDFLLRWRYSKQFEEFQINKKQQIETLQEQITLSTQDLSQQKEEKQSLLLLEQKNLSKLEEQKKSKNELLSQIKKEESKLKNQLQAKKKEREKLNKEIENIIIAQLKAAKSNDAKSVAMSQEFGGNKGKLPWPIKGGFISGKFGKQPHPTLKGVQIERNGIDITISSASNVTSVFEGEVVGVRNIPGHQNMVIVKHGDYYTVYSNLKSVNVAAKQRLNRGDIVGKIAMENGSSMLHFELWQGKNKLNPQPWLQ